jgi:hypothetical protein
LKLSDCRSEHEDQTRYTGMTPESYRAWLRAPAELSLFLHTRTSSIHVLKILIDPFLSDNPSRDNGWSGYLTGKNSTQGSDR